MNLDDATPLPQPADDFSDEEVLETAREMLATLLEKMNIRARVEGAWGEADETGNPPPMLLDVRGDDLTSLIGPRGETLAALQYIVRSMVAHQMGEGVMVQVDVQEYKARRAQQLTRLAERTADQVVKLSRPLTLEPMSPADRRIIHIALRQHESVYTESQGEGDKRKVTVFPK